MESTARIASPLSTSPVGLELLTRSTLRLNRSQRHRPKGRSRGFIDTVAKERLPRVRLGPATPYGLLRIPLPSTPVNSSFRRCLGLAGYRSPGHHSQSRRVVHSTNTTHQYRANPVRTSPSKAITSLSDVPNEAYPRTMSGSLSVGKASAKKKCRTSENTPSKHSGE
jgi:hypothetical protein